MRWRDWAVVIAAALAYPTMGLVVLGFIKAVGL